MTNLCWVLKLGESRENRQGNIGCNSNRPGFVFYFIDCQRRTTVGVSQHPACFVQLRNLLIIYIYIATMPFTARQLPK